MISIDDRIAERVLSGINEGRYALLLGAGFSSSALSSTGRRLPLGQQLADELAVQFGKPIGHPLTMLWDSLPSPQKEQALESRFRNCQVNYSILPIGNYIWRAIYTYNVDDVIEQLYTHDAKQSAISFTHKSPYSTPASFEELRIIHLHGYVNKPRDGYVFSTGDYGISTVLHNAWGPILADDLASTPFVVIGCSLNEYDLEHHIARRGPIDATRETIPSLYINSNLDSVIADRAIKHGFVPIAASAEQFFEWLASRLATPKSLYELIVPKSVDNIFTALPDSKELRIFYRQFLYVRDEELPTRKIVDNFLRGITPAWDDIRAGHDVIRTDVSNIIDELRNKRQTGNVRPNIIIIRSEPGCGKTALLMRLAYELNKLDFSAFYYAGIDRLAPKAAFECIMRSRKFPILIIDNIIDHADQIAQLYELSVGKEGSYAVVGAARDNEIRRINIQLGKYEPRIRNMKDLNSSEAEELVRKMRTEGLLGKKAKLSDKELSYLIGGKPLIVALCEISGAYDRFDDVVKSIWRSASNRQCEMILGAVGIANAYGYQLRFPIAQMVTGANVSEMRTEIASGCLAGIVFQTGYFGEYLEMAHRVLAEQMLDIAIAPQDLFDIYTNLAKRLGPYVNRETVKKRTLEARLASRLLDYKPYVKRRLGPRAREFYASIKSAWEWNSRYWEQLALLELQEKNYGKAIAHAQQAVGIEEHTFSYTTLAKVLMEAAINADSKSESDKYFSDGCAAAKEALLWRRKLRLRDEHAYHVAIIGAIGYCRKWKIKVDRDTEIWITELLEDAVQSLPAVQDWVALSRKWRGIVNGTPQ